MLREALAENVAGVPRRARGRHRHFIADREQHLRAQARSFEIQRLVHVVLRRLVDRLLPVNLDFFAVERGIDSL